MINTEDFSDFLIYQPEMEITTIEKNRYTIEGIYNLSSLHKDTYLYAKYALRIEVPKTYPGMLPQVFDVDGIIPKDFKHFYSDGSLCLGSPMELYLTAIKTGISQFLIKHIDSYMYSATYFIKYNCQFPYGERSHGLMGILEFWKEYLNTDDLGTIYSVLNYISKNNYRGHDLCPCGSERKVRDCHGSIILPIFKDSLTHIAKKEFDLFHNEITKIGKQKYYNSNRGVVNGNKISPKGLF